MKKWISLIFALVAAEAFPAMAACALAATYYVATTGSDSSSGTQASPFATLQKAADVAKAGDTVLVADGDYTSSSETQLIRMANSGNANAWITFQSENPHGAKLNGRNNSTTYMIWFSQNNGGFIRIKDFEVYGFGKIAINTTGAHDIDIVGNDIHDIGRYCNDSSIGSAAVYGSNSPNVTIERNAIHDIGRFNPGERECEPATTYWENLDHGVYLDGMNNASILNNKFFKIQHGWGIQVYSSSGADLSNLVVDGNAFSGANPNRDGQIVLAGKMSNSTLSNNVFDAPRNYAVYFGLPIYSYSKVAINNNNVRGGQISATSPKGVSFSGNTPP
jgi:hypothetical protein